MARVMIVAGFDQSLLLFRKELIASWLHAGHEVIAVAPGRSIEKKLLEIGVKYKEIPLARTSLNPFKDLLLLLKLIQLYIRERPDYLFLYTIKPVIYGSFAACFFSKIKVHAMITGLGYFFISSRESSFFKKLIIFLYRNSLRRSEKVYFQNPDDQMLFQQLKIVEPEKVVRVNGSGVNLEHFQLVEPSDSPVTFLLIARLLREKGIIEYVEAAKLVRKKYPEVKFQMICWDLGGSTLGNKDFEFEKWQAEGVVDIYSETDDVRPYIAASSVYVLPSYREGTPRTVLEAMAMGRAIITTDTPGCRETVVEGFNGFLVPVKDSRALAEAMERFILEPELIKKMGKASRKLAEEKYDVRKVSKVINQAMGLQ